MYDIYIYIYIYMCMCMYIYIYIYIYTYPRRSSTSALDHAQEKPDRVASAWKHAAYCAPSELMGQGRRGRERGRERERLCPNDVNQRNAATFDTTCPEYHDVHARASPDHTTSLGAKQSVSRRSTTPIMGGQILYSDGREPLHLGFSNGTIASCVARSVTSRDAADLCAYSRSES